MYQEHVEVIAETSTSDCRDIDYYLGGNQIYIEFQLLCEALYLGGIEAGIELVAIPSQSRAITEMIKGNGLTSGFTFWKEDLDERQLYVTKATLKSGQFRKALYTSKSNVEKFENLSIPELLQRSVIVNTEWRADIRALSCFKNKYFSGAKYGNMLAMVGQEKVELILHNVAHTRDMRHVFESTTLVPVKGYLVPFHDSLHFAISKIHPEGKRVYEALKRGLENLSERGKIRQAYASVAIFSPEVKTWKTIDCRPHTYKQ